MHIDFLLEKFNNYKDKHAMVWCEEITTYDWLYNQTKMWIKKIREENIPEGSIVMLEGNFSPNAVAFFLALIDCECIIVPLAKATIHNKKEFSEIAEIEFLITINKDDAVEIEKQNKISSHPLYEKLRKNKNPGLVLFSSGSTGKSKATVHNISYLLDKFRVSRHAWNTITFLLYDHIGGINTMLYTLSNGGCIITVKNRTPDDVLKAVEKYKVQLLPTTPTFINLILFSEAYKRYDLSSLELVTYGTEPMPESTLKRFHELFPEMRLLQTYGLSEIGIMRSKSKSSGSLWVKIGGEGFETRVVNNLLEIKAKTAMLGYLNAPSPFTEDGWFITGDAVEVDGQYMKILGRKSEIINVGGEKVYPTEVENVIYEIENVDDVTVYSEKNPIVGNIVCAQIKLHNPENTKEFTNRLKTYCRKKLKNYKVPVKVFISDEEQFSERLKKRRVKNV